MTKQKEKLLRAQGLLTHVPTEPRLIPFDHRASKAHWRAMMTPDTPTYRVQRRLARTDKPTIVERIVRRIRRIRG